MNTRHFRQRVPVDAIVLLQQRKETLAVALYGFFYVGLAGIIAQLIRRWPMPLLGASEYHQDVWYAVVFKFGFLLVVPLLAWRRIGYGASDLWLGWRPTLFALGRVLGAFALGAALNAGRVAPIAAALVTPEAYARTAAGVALAFLQAAWPEEFFFRFLLQTRLEKAFGRLTAIVLTVLLFTAWHLPTRFVLSHGVEGEAGDVVSVLLGTGVPVAIVGLVFSLLWDRYRNFAVVVALHWGIDVLPITWSLLQLPPK